MVTTTLQQQPSTILKVALIGAECTGKTTLCQKLAEHFNTVWVAEHMRTYLQEKWDTQRQTCTWDDLLPIAQGQIDDENLKTMQANGILFCDTTLFELMVYSYLYYGQCPAEIEQSIQHHHYDLIFFTDIDVPWQADGLRDKPNERQEVYDFFKLYLERYQLPYIEMCGNIETRLHLAIKSIQQLLNFGL